MEVSSIRRARSGEQVFHMVVFRAVRCSAFQLYRGMIDAEFLVDDVLYTFPASDPGLLPGRVPTRMWAVNASTCEVKVQTWTSWMRVTPSTSSMSLQSLYTSICSGVPSNSTFNYRIKQAPGVVDDKQRDDDAENRVGNRPP